MRSQLAVMDFNRGSTLQQATTKTGEKRFNTGFSKITNTWSSKPVKEQKDNIMFKTLVRDVIECAKSKKEPGRPVIPDLPGNIAPLPKPNKVEIIENQISRFT